VIHTVLGGVGGKEDFDTGVFELMEGVKEVHRIVSPYKLASRGISVRGHRREDRRRRNRRRAVVVMAGPCSVESRDQIERAADIVADGGARDSRRRVQAALLALQFSGAGRRRPED
jgi:3-deoxy-7-phosphoheptulonate synthase